MDFKFQYVDMEFWIIESEQYNSSGGSGIAQEKSANKLASDTASYNKNRLTKIPSPTL